MQTSPFATEANEDVCCTGEMKMDCKKISCERGLTLIEVLIAVAILATAMMSVFTIYSQCVVEIRRAKNRTLATQYTQMMLEMIISSPYNVSHYQGLSTSIAPPDDNPIREDMLKWAHALNTFPTIASGRISVVEESYSNLVTVALQYGNYGRNTTNILTLKVEKR